MFKLQLFHADRVSGKGNTVTLVEGSARMALPIGGEVAVPLSVLITRRGERWGSPWIAVRDCAKFEGRRSYFSPNVSPETSDALKTLDGGKMYNLLKEAGKDKSIVVEVDNDGYMTTVETREHVRFDSSEFAAAADAAIKKAAEAKQKEEASTPDTTSAKARLKKIAEGK